MSELVTKIKDSVDVIHDIGCDYSNISNPPTIPDAYTKTETDALLAGKVDNDEVYSKAVLNAILDSKADEDNVYDKSQTYSKTEVDSALALKANAADVYDKTAVDSALALKANSADVYTISQTDGLLDLKASVDDSSTTATMATWSASKLNVDFQGKADTSDVYTKAEVDALIGGIKMFPKLDYANPLYTFSHTDTSYTATQDCYLCGTLYPTDQEYAHILINGTIIAANYVFTGSYTGLYVPPIKISSGDVVTVDNLANATSHTDRANVLHIFSEITS